MISLSCLISIFPGEKLELDVTVLLIPQDCIICRNHPPVQVELSLCYKCFGSLIQCMNLSKQYYDPVQQIKQLDKGCFKSLFCHDAHWMTLGQVSPQPNLLHRVTVSIKWRRGKPFTLPWQNRFIRQIHSELLIWKST